MEKINYWKNLIDSWNDGLSDNEISLSLGLRLDEVKRCRSYLENFNANDAQNIDYLTLEEKRRIARSQLGLDNVP
ncbi:MAG: hypothetical protein ACI3ZR_03895 [bacterium]